MSGVTFNSIDGTSFTFIVVWALFPFLDTVIVALPLPLAVIKPFPSTSATAGLEDSHLYCAAPPTSKLSILLLITAWTWEGTPSLFGDNSTADKSPKLMSLISNVTSTSFTVPIDTDLFSNDWYPAFDTVYS